MMSQTNYSYTDLSSEFLNEDNNDAKRKKSKKIIAIFSILLACIAAVVFYFSFFYVKKSHDNIASLSNLPAPIQQFCKNQIITSSGNGYVAEIEFKATYSIVGRVVTKEYYAPTSAKNKLSNYDLGLVWGLLSDDTYKDQISYSSNQNRRLKVSCSNSLLAKLGGSVGLASSLSNNHVIHSNDEILKCLRNIKKGDYIKMQGYLVYVTIHFDNTTDYFVWNSSLSRTDQGDGGCEIIYVTNISWLKETN